MKIHISSPIPVNVNLTKEGEIIVTNTLSKKVLEEDKDYTITERDNTSQIDIISPNLNGTKGKTVHPTGE